MWVKNEMFASEWDWVGLPDTSTRVHLLLYRSRSPGPAEMQGPSACARQGRSFSISNVHRIPSFSSNCFVTFYLIAGHTHNLYLTIHLYLARYTPELHHSTFPPSCFLCSLPLPASISLFSQGVRAAVISVSNPQWGYSTWFQKIPLSSIMPGVNCINFCNSIAYLSRYKKPRTADGLDVLTTHHPKLVRWSFIFLPEKCTGDLQSVGS